MKSGNGKVANLPPEIREELNRRINDGDSGKELAEWLNAKPEVVKMIDELFDGIPISEQNLSQWRTHGYRQWHAYHIAVQETLALANNSADIEETGIDCEKLLLALKANYAEMIQRWIITPTAQMDYRLEVFQNITKAVLSLHRAEIQKERLDLQREKQSDKSESASESRPSASRTRRPAKPEAPPSPETHSRACASSEPPEPAPQPEAAVSSESVESAPKPPESSPAPEANQAPPPAPSAPAQPVKPKIPAYRDPRSRYSLR